MPTSVRLDSETEALLRRLARRTGRTKSDVIREALNRLAAEESTLGEGPSVYDSVADLIGSASGGPADLARTHKRAFREILFRKQRRSS